MTIIKGPDAAAAALNLLLPSLQASLAAAQSGSVDDRLDAVEAVKQQLRDFANSTSPVNLADPAEIAAVEKIDDVARDLHSTLTAGEIETGIASIAAAAGKLRTLSGQLDQLATTNEHAAKSIALDPVRKAVDTMTAMVDSVKSLKANLSEDDPDEAQVAAEIEKLVEQFEVLKQAVGGAGG